MSTAAHASTGSRRAARTATDPVLTRPGDRRLGWATYGDPAGSPLVALHGSPDSHAIWRLADDASRRRGIRVIAPDRPGFGFSDPLPGREVLDWVGDLDAIADHLALDRFPLLTISGGSPYATAYAWMRPDRVTHLGLLSVISPLAEPGVLEGANRMVASTFRIARRAPALLRPLAAAMVRTTRRNPLAAERRLIRTRPPADREIIARPEVLDVLRENLPLQFRDAGSIALEMRRAARDWGFALDEITTPTTIWQGGRDDVHTPAMARLLAARIPAVELVFEPEYATFNWIDRMDEILATLTTPTGSE